VIAINDGQRIFSVATDNTHRPLRPRVSTPPPPADVRAEMHGANILHKHGSAGPCLERDVSMCRQTLDIDSVPRNVIASSQLRKSFRPRHRVGHADCIDDLELIANSVGGTFGGRDTTGTASQSRKRAQLRRRISLIRAVSNASPGTSADPQVVCRFCSPARIHRTQPTPVHRPMRDSLLGNMPRTASSSIQAPANAPIKCLCHLNKMTGR